MKGEKEEDEDDEDYEEDEEADEPDEGMKEGGGIEAPYVPGPLSP